jgi:hypothetical protein
LFVCQAFDSKQFPLTLHQSWLSLTMDSMDIAIFCFL